jgi:galactosamine-6-phosphate isomerase
MIRSDPIQILYDYEALSLRTAEMISRGVKAKPDLLLCAPGGSTPSRAYEILAEKQKANSEEFKQLRIVKLDEWGGIPMDDPGSCETQLQKQLLKPLNVSANRYFSLNSNSDAPENECQRIRASLSQNGPIDLCLLGLGTNGHIGMNEPSSTLQPYTHIATLTDVSLRHPMLRHSSAPPKYGMTLGMTEILASREILMLVSGKAKHAAAQRLLRREITTDFPASFLWLHSNWTLLCDRDAAIE